MLTPVRDILSVANSVYTGSERGRGAKTSPHSHHGSLPTHPTDVHEKVTDKDHDKERIVEKTHIEKDRIISSAPAVPTPPATTTVAEAEGVRKPRIVREDVKEVGSCDLSTSDKQWKYVPGGSGSPPPLPSGIVMDTPPRVEHGDTHTVSEYGGFIPSKQKHGVGSDTPANLASRPVTSHTLAEPTTSTANVPTQKPEKLVWSTNSPHSSREGSSPHSSHHSSPPQRNSPEPEL